MLSISSVLALRELKNLMEYAGDHTYAKFLEEEYKKMKCQLWIQAAWNGNWYAEAFE